MKKQAMLFTLILLTVICFTSCGKKCYGGGWYGDRNLGYTPVKEQPNDAHLKWKADAENCETAEL